MNPLEAIADAIMEFEGWKPGSRSYRNRNPGNLEHGAKVGSKGCDVFPTFVEGYAALLRELTYKFSAITGTASAPTRPCSTYSTCTPRRPTIIPQMSTAYSSAAGSPSRWVR